MYIASFTKLEEALVELHAHNNPSADGPAPTRSVKVLQKSIQDTAGFLVAKVQW
jgi:hypothetical protein